MPGKLIMTRGLPAAGKTQWAREQVAKGNGLTKVVTKDDLRKLLDDGKFSRAREKFVESAQATLIKLALDSGYTVIAADTNLAPRQQARLENIAREKGVAFEVQDFTHVPLDECIRRDQNRPNYVGEQVIKRMYYDHLAPKPPKREWDGEKPWAYIFDLDGTLADLNGRNPYDASTCENDLVREHVAEMARFAWREYFVVLMSGREAKYREQTMRWLNANDIDYELLLMRSEGDTRKDVVIKRELYEQFVEPRFHVVAVFDDRPQVIRGWEELGIPVFNVGKGIEF